MNQGNDFGAGVFCGMVFGFGVIVFPVFYLIVTTPWLKCFLAGGKIRVIDIVGMRLRRSPIEYLVDTHLALIHSGYEVSIKQVESAFVANRHRIVQASDLYEIVKATLPKTEPKPVWTQIGQSTNSTEQNPGL